MDGNGTLAHAEDFHTRGPTSVGTGLLFGGSNTLPETVAEALSRQGWSPRGYNADGWDRIEVRLR